MTAPAEDARVPLTIGWKDETFELSDTPNAAPIYQFAMLAQDGVDSTELEGIAATGRMIEAYLAPHEVARFWAHAAKTRATDDELLAVMGLAVMALTGRPTVRSSDSSDGPSPISAPSSDEPLEKVLARIPAERTDLRLIVHQADQARRATSAASA